MFNISKTIETSIIECINNNSFPGLSGLSRNGTQGLHDKEGGKGDNAPLGMRLSLKH